MKSKHFKYWLGVGAAITLGIILAIAGVGKLFHQFEAFFIFFTPFADFLMPFARIIYFWLPIIELSVALLLITGILAKLAASLALGMVAVFIANNAWMISHGFGLEPCGCFGMLEELAQLRLLTMGALGVDIVMLALALVVLFCYQGKYFNINPWFYRRISS